MKLFKKYSFYGLKANSWIIIMLKFQKLRQDARDVQLILSLSDEQEFKDLEELRETLKDAWTGVQTKVEMNAARHEEHRKLLQHFGETLEKQEKMMKVYREEIAELQKKVSDIEKWLEKYRKQMEQNRDEMNRQTKEKESLMISDESNESGRKADCLSYETKFFAVTSCVRWDTGGQSHEIRGCIAEPHKVTCFNFDKREKSQFYICNRLWETMDPSDDWKNLVTRPSNCQEDAAAPLHSKSVHVCGSEG